ncbi:MAG: hypothetical protein HDR04_04730, partial [Lachnospiraceae bacterium]|nr:hypothetical protein [Lachnospiraceae bacterium]
MGKKLTKFITYLLVIALLMQESTMTAMAANNDNDAVKIALQSETDELATLDDEEKESEEDDGKNEGEKDKNEEEGEESGETDSPEKEEPEESNSDEPDLENPDSEEVDSELVYYLLNKWTKYLRHGIINPDKFWRTMPWEEKHHLSNLQKQTAITLNC